MQYKIQIRVNKNNKPEIVGKESKEQWELFLKDCYKACRSDESFKVFKRNSEEGLLFMDEYPPSITLKIPNHEIYLTMERNDV